MITSKYIQPDFNVQVSALEVYFVQDSDDPAVTVTVTDLQLQIHLVMT